MGRQMNPIWEDSNMGHHHQLSQPPSQHPPHPSQHPAHYPQQHHHQNPEQVQKENRPVMSVIRASGSAAAAWSTTGVIPVQQSRRSIPVQQSRRMTVVPTTQQ